MSSLKAIFGTNLRQARKARGLTLERLAEESGLSIETVGRIERGQTGPSFDTVEILAKALAVAPQTLFGLEGHVRPDTPRGRYLQQLQGDAAKATDAQLELLVGLAAVVVGKKSL